MTNSADPDQLASSEANWSGSTLFAKTGHVVFSKRRVELKWLKNEVIHISHMWTQERHRPAYLHVYLDLNILKDRAVSVAEDKILLSTKKYGYIFLISAL